MHELTKLIKTFILLLTFFSSAAVAQSLDCIYPFDAEEKQLLIDYSDTQGLTSFSSAQPAVDAIADILVSKGDHRGIFALFYRNILSTAVPAVEAGDFRFDAWADRVSLEFVKLYLDNLHGHLTNGDVTLQWKNFYGLAADCDRSVGRKAMAALTAHLIVDFPRAIENARSYWFHSDDFFKFGDLLTQVTLAIAQDVNTYYNYDLSDFFGLYFFGDIIDGFTQDDFTSMLFFQSVRANSWRDGLALRSFWVNDELVESEMFFTWLAGEFALEEMEHIGLL